MEVKITTLSENTANYGYLAEWGLSILVQTEGINILVDTGMGSSAIQNARLLDIDLASLDCIVLSHGHADHTGGLLDLLKKTGGIEVIAHPDIWVPKYVRRPGQVERFIGLPFSRELLENLGARFKMTKEPFKITDAIMTTGEIPMVTDFESIEDSLFIKENDTLIPDPLADDLALVLKTDFGLVVILGCAHRGIINTLRHAQQLTNTELIYAVIGGTHLLRASEEQIEKTIENLKEMGVQRVGAAHCTGFRAEIKLNQELNDIFFLNNSGTQITLP
jgi:7,8-dihydropterin-6-yl-methyl-4-(beta-D-ribofuranosyl)aminobenzene 5'-phosphate synthase